MELFSPSRRVERGRFSEGAGTGKPVVSQQSQQQSQSGKDSWKATDDTWSKPICCKQSSLSQQVTWRFCLRSDNWYDGSGVCWLWTQNWMGGRDLLQEPSPRKYSAYMGLLRARWPHSFWRQTGPLLKSAKQAPNPDPQLCKQHTALSSLFSINLY